jgi:hypothetical protein
MQEPRPFSGVWVCAEETAVKPYFLLLLLLTITAIADLSVRQSRRRVD